MVLSNFAASLPSLFLPEPAVQCQEHYQDAKIIKFVVLGTCHDWSLQSTTLPSGARWGENGQFSAGSKVLERALSYDILHLLGAADTNPPIHNSPAFSPVRGDTRKTQSCSIQELDVPPLVRQQLSTLLAVRGWKSSVVPCRAIYDKAGHLIFVGRFGMFQGKPFVCQQKCRKKFRRG
jgi:hypothetical protein